MGLVKPQVYLYYVVETFSKVCLKLSMTMFWLLFSYVVMIFLLVLCLCCYTGRILCMVPESCSY